MTKKNKDAWAAFGMLLPFMLFFTAFVLYPLLVNLYYSFTNYRMGANAVLFVGFDNYTRMFRDADFLISLRNTFVYAFFSVSILTLLGLFISSALNRAAKTAKALRVVFLMPYATSLAAAALVWMLLLDPSLGFINKALISLGASQPPGWLFSTDYALPSLVGINIWKNMGYVMLIFLAGLQGVSLDLYEAATIDGAGKWHRFRYITLPSIAPITAFVVAATTIEAFKTFELVNIMTKGGPVLRTSTVVYQIYIRAFEDFQMGYAAAMSTVLLLVLLSVSLLQFKKIIQKP
jgi:ABC-type sugar transport system permease subunit